MPSTVISSAQHAKHWLFDQALPLWWQRGADHDAGGFFEKIGQDGYAVGRTSRVRVQARQTYVYARAGVLGWPGPWRAAMNHGLSFMLAHYPKPDGLFRSTLDAADQSIDLYDQAFVLFALAHAYVAENRPPELLHIARTLLQQIERQLAVAEGGFRESLPPQPLLKSNPLMHLLEALLAWVATGADGNFRAAALALCEFAQTRLIDSANGALGEMFDTSWRPPAAPDGQVYEPGHQFEWAYLLLQAQELLDVDTTGAALALEAFGRKFGIDPTRQVAVFSINESGDMLDRRARLWAQTERLRTSLLFARAGYGNAAVSLLAAASSLSVISAFLSTPVGGLWHEWQTEAGEFETSPAPASSLYHLMTGLGELVADESELQFDQRDLAMKSQA